MEFKRIKHFQSDFPEVMKVIVCADNSLILCSSVGQTIKHMYQSGNRLIEISTFKLPFIDVAESSSGDLLFSTEEHHLKVIQSGTIKDVQNFEVPEGRIITIHLDDWAQKVILGVCMHEFKEPGKVIVMDNEGHHEKKYQFGPNNKWLFQSPACIATNKKNIAVVDCGDANHHDNSGTVVIISKDYDDIIHTYKGDIKTYVNAYHPFRPHDIVATNQNNFIVSDTCVYNQILHILDSDGKYLTHVNTQEVLGISLPYFLSFDKTTGLLYVGSQTYKGAYHTDFFLVQIGKY